MFREYRDSYVVKYPCPYAAWLYEQDPDDQASNPYHGGWVGLYGRRVLVEHSDGAVSYERFATAQEALDAFDDWAEDLGAYEDDEDPSPVPVRVAFEDASGDAYRRVTWYPGSSTFHVEASTIKPEMPWVEVDVFTHYGDDCGTPPTLEQAAEVASAYLGRVDA